MTPADLFDAAITAARGSPNQVRKVGAVLLPGDGGAAIATCNTFPAGVADTGQRHLGDGRLIWMEHAERNAIYAAARSGRSTQGATLASSYFPCTDCARAIVQAGIRRLITLAPDPADPVWGASFGPSETMLREAGVVIELSGHDPAQVHAATMRPA
ncbi:MAG TPA: deaminase [Burkholderiaceae bacterium]|nr:deaminase [Burkholderiaceae bacterium]